MVLTKHNQKLPRVTRRQIAAGLRKTGLKSGDVAFVHSAMRTFGYIEGGADAAVDALLEVLGPRGTLVVPTFTFAHEAEENPVVDPRIDPSEMGIISETVRQRPEALRSTAYRHSFAAIGPRAKVITEIDPALSPFDVRASFGVMLALNTQIMLLGMTYSCSTSHHFGELICDVPYRHTIPLNVKIRLPDGSLVEQKMTDYQPKPSEDGSYYGTRHPDFNRLGRMLEERGFVGVAAIGNAAVRRFPMRCLIDLAQSEAEKDYDIFRAPDGQMDYVTPLDFGTIVTSPEMRDGAGRLCTYEWCVMDEKMLLMPG